MDRVRDLLGDDAARSLERLAELTKMLNEAGLIEQSEGRLELTPKGLRKIGSNALRDLFAKLTKDQIGQHQVDRLGPRPRAHLRDQAVRVRRPVPPRPAAHDPQRARARGRARGHAGAARSPTTSRSSAPSTSPGRRTVLMLDLSLSMPMRDNFLPAKKVAMALHSLITSQFPRDYLGLVGFSETARILKRRAAARGQLGLRLRHQHAARLRCSPASCSPGRRGTKQIIMITDGEPTAHITPQRRRVLQLPAGAARRSRRRCARCCAAPATGIRINTFMLDATSYLKAFVERLTEINRGRAFFTTPETLGDYVLVDFIEHKRQQARGRAPRRLTPTLGLRDALIATARSALART